MSGYDYRKPEEVLEELRRVRAKAYALELKWTNADYAAQRARSELEEAQNKVTSLLEELKFQAKTEPTREEP